MDGVLIVSSSAKGRDFLSGEINEYIDVARTVSAKSGGEARRTLCDSEFDMILIDTPLSDEVGFELAMHLIESTLASIMVFVKSEIADEVSSSLEPLGICVITKPINKTFFYRAVRLITASRARIMGLKRENVKLMQRLDELKLVDRAKCTLIQYLGMTEQAAHRYIEKQAMDMRTTKKEIAENILKTYEQ